MAQHALSRKPKRIPAPVKPRKRRDAQTEEALLAATHELLIDKRSLDFSLAEVADRTGLSAALVQYYFGGKLGLLGALLEWSSSRYVAQLNDLLAMEIPATEKLRFHVLALVKTYTKTPYIDRLLHHLINESDDAGAQRISDYYVKRVVEFYRQLIEQGVREGVMRPIDPIHVYFVLLGIGDHLAARRRLLKPLLGANDMDDQFAREFGEVLLGLLMNGIRADR